MGAATRAAWRRYNPLVAARVLVPEATLTGEQLELPAEEAAHVSRVLRVSAGDALRVFNGRGDEWNAQVVACTRASVTVTLGARAVSARETRVKYTVALAVLKGDGTDDAVRDAVMMGASSISPFVSARSDVTAVAALRGHRLDRWRRIAASSAKQCGRAVVPEVAPPVALESLVAGPWSGVRIWLTEPAVARVPIAIADLPAPEAATLAVGPEGGWTPDEVLLAERAGWMLVSLGGRTLRATSAPLAALAACQAVWRDD